jgi:hypothetical protein
MKSFLAAMAVLLVLPGAAFARLVDPPVKRSSHHASAPYVVPVQAYGTDVAAPDQQSPKPAPAPVHVAAPAPSFDWGTAAIGAASSLVLMTALLGVTLSVRRRQTRPPSVVTG